MHDLFRIGALPTKCTAVLITSQKYYHCECYTSWCHMVPAVVEVKKRISGSVNQKDKYVMIEKLKDKNKNVQSV